MYEKVIIAIILAWFIAQAIKQVINKKFSWKELLIGTGGMPSSHSSTVSGLATMVYLYEGTSLLFIVTFIFSLVVLRDSFGVRRQSQLNAQAINTELMKGKNHFRKIKVQEGHTGKEVLAGIIIGIVVSIVVFLI